MTYIKLIQMKTTAFEMKNTFDGMHRSDTMGEILNLKIYNRKYPK